MSLPSVSPASSERAAPPEGDATRLRGRWLLLVRVAWLGLAALCATVFALSQPIAFVQSEQVCSGDNCSDPHLTPQDIPALAHAGLSPAFFATYLAVLSIVFALVWVVIGALIFWRKSDEPRTLYFALFLVAFGTIWVSDPRSTLAVVYPAWRVPAVLLAFLGQSCFLIFGYVFPDGRFVPRWTRWLALALIVGNVTSYFFPGSALDLNNGPLSGISILLLFGTIIFAQVYRYRRVSTQVQRQQTKWIMLALVTALLIYSSAFFFGQDSSLLFKFIGSTLLELALLGVPLAIGLAIMRYRLWDVDAIINKTLVYGLLTGLLGALYAGFIIGLENLISLFGGTAAQNPLALVISTLAVAALFLPLRRRIQNLIDRRFYRRKYDAEKTLAAFSATLRNEVDLEELRTQLLAVVQETMQPAHVSLWLRQPEPRAQEQAHPLEPYRQMPAGQDRA